MAKVYFSDAWVSGTKTGLPSIGQFLFLILLCTCALKMILVKKFRNTVSLKLFKKIIFYKLRLKIAFSQIETVSIFCENNSY